MLLLQSESQFSGLTRVRAAVPYVRSVTAIGSSTYMVGPVVVVTKLLPYVVI